MISLTIFLSFLLLGAGCSLYVGGRIILDVSPHRQIVVAGGRVYDRDESPEVFYLSLLAWIGIIALSVASAGIMLGEWVSRLPDL
jgi:hypothetical protein